MIYLKPKIRQYISFLQRIKLNPLPTLAKHILRVSATTRHLSEVRDFVARHARKFGFSESDVEDIRLAVDEAYTNVVKHAYHNDTNQVVQIELGGNNYEFWISLIDDGDSFDPKTYHEPNIQQSIHNGKRGGVGVYLIRQLMDMVEYRKSDGQNEIRMRKTLRKD